jgi:hypothetical protein
VTDCGIARAAMEGFKANGIEVLAV